MIDRDSDPGSWALALAHSVNIRVMPDVTLKGGFDAVEGGPYARPAVCVSLHVAPSEPKGQRHHGR